jgi:hypothetical protein
MIYYNSGASIVRDRRGTESKPDPMSDDNSAIAPANAQPPAITFAEFLESAPPSQFMMISDLWVTRSSQRGSLGYRMAQPEIQLHCPNDICNGPRVFRCDSDGMSVGLELGQDSQTYITYRCSNCRKTSKLFSLNVSTPTMAEQPSGRGYKFGEYPPYGPPTPTRLLRLFGQDREIFLKGRRCENQGLGIGAFVYYRRVVESHKDQILDEVIKVARKVAPEHIEALSTAKEENQFLKAIESVKDAIPQALLINGHNPLTLLHSALSEGLHAKTDEQCLELAQAVRVVLAELAERISQVLKDEAELKAAVTRLMRDPS